MASHNWCWNLLWDLHQFAAPERFTSRQYIRDVSWRNCEHYGIRTDHISIREAYTDGAILVKYHIAYFRPSMNDAATPLEKALCGLIQKI
jgi:hypothetical protein